MVFPNDLYARARAVDIVLTVPRSFLFFYGRPCSQPCEGANVSRGTNTRLRNRYPTGLNYVGKPFARAHARDSLIIHGPFYGLKNFCCKTVQFCATRRESNTTETPSVSSAA